MDIKTYEDQPEYKESALAAKNASQTDAANPGKMAIENDASLATIVQSFIAIQSQTNHSLIEYISKTIAPGANDVAIGTDTLDKDGQQQFLINFASSQREKPAPADFCAPRSAPRKRPPFDQSSPFGMGHG